MNRFIIGAMALLMMTSCYEDYLVDNDFQAVGFANQTDVRTFVIGEGMRFSTGVALAGTIENKEDRIVSYEIDNSLVNETTLSQMKNHSFSYISALYAGIDELEVLPASEYNLIPQGNEAGKVTIEKGSHLGVIEVTVDSAAFLADITRVSPKYAIPIRITGCDAAQLLEGRTTTVIGVRYENMLFGSYWHGGYTVVTDADGNQINKIEYPTAIPQSDNLVWTLTTVEPFSLTANAVGNEVNSAVAQMKLTLKDDDSITISPVEGATYVVEQDGECRFLRTKLLQERKIALKYKYEKDGKVYHATDTLTFRNRIRDGVNEWQDENPEHYN